MTFTGKNFQMLFNIVRDAMLLVDINGKIVHANLAAQHLFDYAEEDICKLDVEALMPARYREHHQHFRHAYHHTPDRRNMGHGRVLTILKKNGIEQQVDIGLNPFQVDDQLYVLTTFHPVDRRRAAEEALSETEERLSLAKKAAGLAIFDFDGKLKPLHLDDEVYQWWGSETADSLKNAKFRTYIHPDDRKLRMAALKRSANPETGGEYQHDYRVISPSDGALNWVSATGRMHFQDGNPIRLVGVIKNITQQKLFEKQIQEQRNEAETIFKQQVAAQTVSAIAHEINQPLSAISAYSEVLLRALKHQDYSQDSFTQALKGCVHQAERAGRIVHELLTFLHKNELPKTPFDINRAITDALNVAKNDGYGEFHTELKLKDSMPKVMGSKIQIQKVIINLVRNAVEAMRGKGTDLSKITITVQTNDDENMAHIFVSDNGPGLDAEIQKRIFEPFFTTKPTGIGMGLAISRAIVEANGGKLWFEPNQQQGALFRFTLPLMR